MSYVGCMFRSLWNSNSSTVFKVGRKVNFSQQSTSPFKRSFHIHTNVKRPKVSTGSSKWNVYDELKLFSYTSHLAFFMLLPPIIQMYTTKVEVTHDDTLCESSFQSLQTSDGLIIKNMNFLDILESEKNKLVNLYIQNENIGNTTATTTIKSDLMSVLKTKLNEKIDSDETDDKNNYESIKDINTAGNNESFDIYLTKLDEIYQSLKNSKITNKQYFSKIEELTDGLISLDRQRNNFDTSVIKNNTTNNEEFVNNTIVRIFDQLHKLKLHEFESILFRRLLTSYEQPEMKYFNIKQKVLKKYELNKKIHSKHSKKLKLSSFNKINNVKTDIPIHKTMQLSIWLHSYTKSFERFAQLVQMFAVTNQSKQSFYSLFQIGFNSSEVCEKLKNSNLRYGLISALRGLNKEKEALTLEKMSRKLITEKI